MSTGSSGYDDFMEDEDFGSEEPSQPSSGSPPLKVRKNTDSSWSDEGDSGTSILTIHDVDKRIKAITKELREVISPLSYDEALIVLNRFGWALSTVQDKWFEDASCVRTTAGLGPSHPHQAEYLDSPVSVCGICLCEPVGTAVAISSCMHAFCKLCYKKYLEGKISDGHDSLQTRCPFFKCPLVVPQSMFKDLVEPTMFEKLLEWQRNWFVMSHKDQLRWCPNPAGCGRLAPNQRRVNCDCGFEWCWQCMQEFHEPVSCELATQWSEKNSSESENVTWIIANTKPCPACRKPIEKNQGCNHMRCPSSSGGCGAEFCWMCLGEWRTHSDGTGGFYKCNLYTKSGVTEAIEEKRKASKAVLERYMFYFSRFMNHHKAQLLARKELDKESPKWLESLHTKLDQEIGDLEFIQDALRQVATCRHVLKYTYVYGFYLMNDNGLFEYLQKNLEEFTDRLHEYVEKDLMVFLDSPSVEESSTPPIPIEELKVRFAEFRSTVANQCSVTKKFFKQIVEELSSRTIAQ
jgi:ariadne-1